MAVPCPRQALAQAEDTRNDDPRPFAAFWRPFGGSLDSALFAILDDQLGIGNHRPGLAKDAVARTTAQLTLVSRQLPLRQYSRFSAPVQAMERHLGAAQEHGESRGALYLKAGRKRP